MNTEDVEVVNGVELDFIETKEVAVSEGNRDDNSGGNGKPGIATLVDDGGSSGGSGTEKVGKSLPLTGPSDFGWENMSMLLKALGITDTIGRSLCERCLAPLKPSGLCLRTII